MDFACPAIIPQDRARMYMVAIHRDAPGERHSLFPPRAELLDAYEAEGRDRAERFLKERGYSQK